MADVKEKGKKVYNGLKALTVSLFLGANAVSLLLLWACCASTWIDPVSHPRVAVFGLFFPILLFFNLLFIPFWLLAKPRLTLVPLAGLGLCTSFILDYLPLSGGAEPTEDCLSVLTWNVGAMPEAEQRNRAAEYIVHCDADIICLQEASEGWCNNELGTRMDSAGYIRSGQRGRFIFTRLPLLAADTIPACGKTSNGIARYGLGMDGDTLWVMNCHMESNQLDCDEKQNYQEALRTGERKDLEREGIHMVGRLAESTPYRGAQTDSLTQAIDRQAGDLLLVIGDFNDTPISYTYQQVKRRLQNAFRKAGRGVGVSYNQHGFPVRIDHIFCSDHWECVRCEVRDTVHASDHYPVAAWLRIKAQGK